jgi:hypothetical protein
MMNTLCYLAEVETSSDLSKVENRSRFRWLMRQEVMRWAQGAHIRGGLKCIPFRLGWSKTGGISAFTEVYVTFEQIGPKMQPTGAMLRKPHRQRLNHTSGTIL